MPKRKFLNKKQVKKQSRKIIKFIHNHFLVIIGFSLIIFSLANQLYSITKLSFIPFPPTQAYAENQIKEKAVPTFIRIPKIELALPIFQTKIQNGVWEIDSKGISHLSSSASPGMSGNIVLYAHNTNDRFGNLPLLNIGDKIIIITQDGQEHTYILEKILIVNPTDIEVVQPTIKETLTLYTCYGLADLKRFVVQAKPIKNF